MISLRRFFRSVVVYSAEANPSVTTPRHRPAMSAGKAVIQIFDRYQKERVLFVQSVADLATRPQNVEALMNAGVMALLRPLLLDNVPSQNTYASSRASSR